MVWRPSISQHTHLHTHTHTLAVCLCSECCQDAHGWIHNSWMFPVCQEFLRGPHYINLSPLSFLSKLQGSCKNYNFLTISPEIKNLCSCSVTKSSVRNTDQVVVPKPPLCTSFGLCCHLAFSWLLAWLYIFIPFWVKNRIHFVIETLHYVFCCVRRVQRNVFNNRQTTVFIWSSCDSNLERFCWNEIPLVAQTDKTC